MQKSDSPQTIKVVRHPVQPSTTLNRKYVARPTSHQVQVKKVAVTPAVDPAKTAAAANAEALKEQAVKRALEKASKPEPIAKPHKLHFGFGRLALAFVCTVAAVFALIYFVNLNIFDFSIANAASQAGIEVSSSPRIPSGYHLVDVSSESGKITLNYQDGNKEFSIIEEKTSWNSSALLTMFVVPTYGDDFSTVREQGLTIYISDSNAVWVNNGILRKILAKPGTLTKKQLCQIAASL